MTRTSLAGLIGLLVASFVAPTAATELGDPEWAGPSEILVYRWRLEGVPGVLGRIVGLFPTIGDGVMSSRLNEFGRLECEFKATSEKARISDHWTYRTLVDLEGPRTLSVRNSYLYRDKHREKAFDLRERVLDVLSALHVLRRTPVDGPQRMTLWSDGRVYPVSVIPNGSSVRSVGGRELRVRHFSIKSVREPDRDRWKGHAEIWLADDQEATPVELIYRQRLGRLRMTLVEPWPFEPTSADPSPAG